MKIVKFALLAVLAVVALVVAFVAALPLWIGPVATGIANAVGPELTQTEFLLGKFALNPYSGHLAVGDLTVANPEGFPEKTALSLGGLSVDVEVSSLLGDTLVVKDLLVRDVFVSYVKNGVGTNNVDAILTNVRSSMKSGAEAGTTASETPEEKQKSDLKIIIDHMRVEGVRAKWGVVTIPVPTIDLTGIGRKSMGVSASEAGQQIWAAILQGLSSAGVNLKSLGVDLKALGVDTGKLASEWSAKGLDTLNAAAKAGKIDEGTQKAVDALGDAVKAIKLDQGADKARESLKSAGDALKGLFK